MFFHDLTALTNVIGLAWWTNYFCKHSRVVTGAECNEHYWNFSYYSGKLVTIT